MIDIHMHVIPGVDDGASDFDTAHKMIDMAYAQGIRGIIATPHADSYRRLSDEIHHRFEYLQAYVRKNYPDMHIALGAEVYCDMPFLPDTLHQLKKGCFPTLNGTKFVLCEFSPYAEQTEVRTVLTALIADGWRPVIAHAERSSYAFSDFDFVRELIDMGCKVQVNAYSLFEETSTTIRRLARRLLNRELIHFLGSDAHHSTRRAPKVEKGLGYIEATCSEEYAERLLFKNAQELLGI